MIKANYTDKALIINILCKSFDKNKSVNHVIKQDNRRKQRIRLLMDYSFEICYMFGHIFLTDDKKACALTLFPDRKKTSLRTILLDLKMAIYCVGLNRVFEISRRSSKIENAYPKTPIYYLWFIGVTPDDQGRGIGSTLLQEVIKVADSFQRPVYLETSMSENIPFYEKFGFAIYKELEFEYRLFLLKK